MSYEVTSGSFRIGATGRKKDLNEPLIGGDTSSIDYK